MTEKSRIHRYGASPAEVHEHEQDRSYYIQVRKWVECDSPKGARRWISQSISHRSVGEFVQAQGHNDGWKPQKKFDELR